ncbi:ATP-binding cassette domain-containing protein [Polaromonas sp.]|uniref:ATP-binding cassette domain-containing protein n=1 Tax=Polaromonas sp. TaxID=1869339 RepID=UPI002869F4BC|nr:ATP-binding cassette domain-containing protein [Polaromonas sp.]
MTATHIRDVIDDSVSQSTQLEAKHADAPVLRARDLHKSYAGKPALTGLSLTLFPGEMVALLGPNGSGKSTLMQLLTGLFSPDRGDIEVLGHNMRTHASAALAGLGVVFQQTALDLDLSVQANLLFHTDLHGLPRGDARERIAEGLAQMRLTGQVGATVRSLSGGTRRKVELVRALLHRPRVLLMDEATVGLDPGSRLQLLQGVRKLVTESQVAVLWATHLMEEIDVSDRLLVLKNGTLQFDGIRAAFTGQLSDD